MVRHLRRLKKKIIFSALFIMGMAIAMLWLGGPITASVRSVPSHHSEHDERVAQARIETALEPFNQGQIAFDSGDWQTALDHWQQAIASSDGNRLFQAVVRNHMAIAYQRLGQWAEADNSIQSGWDLLEQDTGSTRRQTRENVQTRAQLLNTRGRLEWSLGQSDQALSTWKRATVLYEAIGDTTGILGSQVNQVQAMESLGYYRQACDRVLTLLDASHTCQDLVPKEDLTASQNPTDTLQSILKSITEGTVAESPTPDPVTNTSANETLFIRLMGLRSLGNVLRLTGQLEQSQEVLMTALTWSNPPSEIVISSETAAPSETTASSETVSQPLPYPLPDHYLLTLLSLATTQKAQYLKAKTLYSRTRLSTDRAIAAQLAAQTLQHYDRVIALTPDNTFTRLQAQLQQLDLLMDLVTWNQQAQQVNTLRPIRPPADFPSESWPALPAKLTPLLDELLPFPSASQDRPIQPPLPISRQSIDAYLALAQQMVQWQTVQPLIHPTQSSQAQAAPPRKDGFAIAQQLAEIAGTQADQLSDFRSQSYAYGVLGHIYETRYEARGNEASRVSSSTSIDQAQAATLNALGLAQSAQIPEITYRWQWQLGRLAEKQGQEEEAIAYYEAAVKTLDTVRSNLLNIDADVQFSFRDDVEPIYRRLVELLLAQNDGHPSQESLRRAIHDIDALQLSELENFLGCNLTESVALSETLVDPTAVVVYPIILQNQLAVVTKWPHTDELHLHAIAINEADVKAKLTAFRRELSRPFRTSSGLRLSQELYDWLIRPVEPLLTEAEAETLVFVLDGKFRNVPMATLHDGEHYLVQNYALALMPGLQLLEPQPLSTDQLDVLTFGLSQMRKEFPPHKGFEDLSNVEVEVNEIQNQLPSRLFLNQDFTQTTLAQRIERVTAPIIHLATHGQFSSEPSETFVLAWDQRIDVNTLSTILQARSANPIELLVMSACKTAEGDDRAALGLAGIAVRSGARSTLASLWTVDDRATADMMSEFYRELGQGTERGGDRSSSPIAKAEALRRAQVKLLESEQFNAPRYWAPFILVGNWL